MSIRKDVTVKITNNNATLDMPLQIYELDHGIELRFKLMDYKYKYTKDPQNILNSSDEDILEAYTTIINPKGYELQQINGEVKDDIVIFVIDSSYTDEIDEIGTYKLQIHIKCACSEFSIPPIQFEVLQRLKGVKVVTDGEDLIDDSALIDNYSNFISDETGKLLIEWQKGDIISSVKLNAMVEVINNAVDEEVQRQLNEVKREQQELERQNKLQEALNSVDTRVDESMFEYETRFNALTVSQQQDMEVIDARDGEASLKARLDRDLRNPLQVYEDVEDSHISCDSIEGYAQNVEILGNTIQNQNDLADIRSVGDKLENQELYEIPVLSCGKNLVSSIQYLFGINADGSGNVYANNNVTGFCKVRPNTTYVTSINGVLRGTNQFFYDIDKKFISKSANSSMTFTTPNNCYYVRNTFGNSLEENFQIEEGTVATPYEPYQEDKLTILSPVQLEKVGDVADRIICKDGVWGVEKNIETVTFNGSEVWLYNANGDDNLINTVGFSTKLETTGIETVSIMENFKFLTKTSVDEEGHAIKNEGTKVYIRINKTRLSTVDIRGFELYLNSNPVVIYYQTTQPQFIPLPYDQQIKLRTFASKTNISFGCEIEPTLKASIPKSIGAALNAHTEQIDNISKEIEKIKKLEESIASTVTSESNFTTVENTTNGYFDDVKLEGRTLVNLCGKVLGTNADSIEIKDDIVTFNDSNGAKFIAFNVSLLKPNTTYTLIILGINVQTMIRCDLYPDNFPELTAVDSDKPIGVSKFTTPNDISSLSYIRYYVHNGVPAPSTLYSPIILEGDHTQNPPLSYFKGIKNVGQDVDELSVLSTNNRCYDNTFVLGMIASADGTLLTSSNDWCSLKNYINVKSGRKYFVSLENADNIENQIGVSFYNNDNYVSLVDIDNNAYITIPSNVNAIKIRYKKLEGKSSNIYNLNVFVGENDTKSKQDKKRILYYNDETKTWEKPILRQWDSIEKHSDGKYYYHKRSEEVVLNGSENWELAVGVQWNNKTLTCAFSFTLEDGKGCIWGKYIPSELSSNFSNYGDIELYNSDIEGFTTDNEYGNRVFRILKSKLSTQDVAGFKAWLQANPTTVVYRLAEEKVYECTSLDLITYENETNFIVNTGTITPLSTLQVKNNIGNIVLELQQKVSNLENYIQHVMIDALNNALNE